MAVPSVGTILVRATVAAMTTSRLTRRSSTFAAAGAVALLLGACGSEATSSGGETDSSLSVMATTTMLGDITAQIVDCGGGEVTTLMAAGVDPHDFSPSSAQVAEMVGADLVVVNGLGLEEALEDALESAEADGATLFEVAPLLDPIEFGAGGHDHDEEKGETHAEDDGHDHAEDDGHDHAEDDGHDHAEDDGHDHGDEKDEAHTEDDGHDHGPLDPHVWQDVSRMALAAELIAAELGEVAGDAETYEACGAEVAASLTELDGQVREILDTVPDDRRVLITDHDAFGYLAAAYGFEIAGVVIPGGSTMAETSSQELAALVDVVDDEGVDAVFSNATLSSGLVDALTREVGSSVEVVELFVDSLGPEGSGADTYSGMMLTNAERIAAALGG
jgi:zinc/manganese transport system substrate-binding protein